jgi:hypothetical protein
MAKIANDVAPEIKSTLEQAGRRSAPRNRRFPVAGGRRFALDAG